ncbi:HD domain-containing protein [Desulfohalovibrio reitneri]|uniref:HD domain-containing protein n=1 Tax=Desulfohalovibrio reitneri TaxID=1307759 RepID=UPI0004A78489|nr:HD domain-containing protein [Desulfohalovibrio reitneri]
MPSIRKSLLQLLFSGSYMKRWNDKLRPIELYEVDKQAHKMLIAWALFEINSRGMSLDERTALGGRIVEGGLFEYMYRLIITDIKPPVFYQIKENPEHYARLTGWVVEQLTPRIQVLGPEFCTRLENYLAKPDHEDLAGRILFASHIYASRAEFLLIKDINPWDEELEEIEADFQQTLERHADIEGVPDLLTEGSNLDRFARLAGRLRFQTRWSQTPRIPETSVLGHMFIVACFAYLFCLEQDACEARKQNSFFAGLVHDLPELLTRDIISPVKRSVEGIADLIQRYERDALDKRVFSLLRSDMLRPVGERLAYFLGLDSGGEFVTRVRKRDGKVVKASYESLRESFEGDEYDPLDGGLLKICDSLAAFLEAYTAMRNGITSEGLQQSLWRIRGMYAANPYQHGVHIGSLLADFD